MRIFAFDPADYVERYQQQGWVHIKEGIDREFLQELERVAARLSDVERLDQFAIRGKKEQALFDFPSSTAYPDEIFDVAAAVCGLRRQTMTLSERHIQIYEPDANPSPTAHKDRFPSQVSIGFSVVIPEESRLVLYPYDHRELNPFNKSTDLISHLQPDEHPDVALRGAREIEIADRAGDVVMFAGSTTWHLRRRSAGAINLYVKCNDFDCDPLGEDPGTAARREHTLRSLSSIDREELGEQNVVLSRRLDCTCRRRTRNVDSEVLEVSLYGEHPIGVTEAQLEILSAVDGASSVNRLLGQIGGNGTSRGEALSDTARLLELGVLDLLP